jgi:hypothetical protein
VRTSGIISFRSRARVLGAILAAIVATSAAATPLPAAAAIDWDGVCVVHAHLDFATPVNETPAANIASLSIDGNCTGFPASGTVFGSGQMNVQVSCEALAGLGTNYGVFFSQAPSQVSSAAGGGSITAQEWSFTSVGLQFFAAKLTLVDTVPLQSTGCFRGGLKAFDYIGTMVYTDPKLN